MSRTLYLVGLDGSAGEYYPSISLKLNGYKREEEGWVFDARAFYSLELAEAYQEKMKKKYQDILSVNHIGIYEITTNY